jgi:hypothetical protein
MPLFAYLDKHSNAMFEKQQLRLETSFPLHKNIIHPSHPFPHVMHSRFANGVALSADESFVAVADSNSFSIHRYWLKVRYSEGFR